MAHYDVLTNLPNRSLFNTTLRRAFDRQDHDQILGILYVDLDHFKAINDTHGHAIGDTVLAEAGRRIEQAVGNSNMVARLGGDEFAVLLDRLADRQEALGIAQAIVSAMDDPIGIEGQVQPLPIGASVGVAFAPDNGLTGEDVLKAADLALYDAKSRGRSGASVFDPGMQQEVQDRRALELDLRAALSRGELEVQYQPLKDAATTETVGYEALLRWHHPERGDVSPAVFIPIAEETGQIMAIGSWVLREALNEAANWPEHLTVSVNLSPAQMRDEGLLNTIVGALAASGVAPQRLELEITESLLMQDNDDNFELLHRIRDIGVQIALDDFGTGYSSSIICAVSRSIASRSIAASCGTSPTRKTATPSSTRSSAWQASSRCGPRPRAWSIPSSSNAFAQRAVRPSRGSCSTAHGRPQSWNTVPSFALPVRSRRRCHT